MNDSFVDELFSYHEECTNCPSKQEVGDFFNRLLGLLFPNYSSQRFTDRLVFDEFIENLKSELRHLLQTGISNEELDADSETESFFASVAPIYRQLQEDIEAMYEGDPAATSKTEVIRSYPGFYAIAAYRFAHQLAVRGVHLIPRMITEHAHSRTGIDIHPNAVIGHHFCIDHGTGVVIGETTEIGNHVKIYQGVTLGALSVKKEDAKTKRHPTIGDHVVIYAGATILGGKTVIGSHSVIGGNSWITKSIPEHSKVYYQSSSEDQKTNSSNKVINSES